MKNFVVLIILLPFFAYSQVEVILHIQQSPELGFELTSQDTTIVWGDSLTLGTDLVVFGGSGDYSFSWSPGDEMIDSTMMNPVAYPADTTTYFLTVTDSLRCSFSLSYTVNVQEFATYTKGTIEKQNLRAILFPNPNSGQFKVQLSGEPREKIELIIIDNSGRTIKRQTIRNFSGEHTEILEISLPGGIYNLVIDSSIARINRRFIIN